MYRYGLKLWSTNVNYIPDAVRLFRERVYQYIELFVIPESYDQWFGVWKKLMNEEGVPFVIHAPHSRGGMNLAVRANMKNNMKMAKEAVKFVDGLKADFIIFHPGIGGKEEETAYQLKQINDPRIVVENKPYCAIDGRTVCNGYSPEQIGMIMSEAGVGFCLDIGHAFCAANSISANPYDYLREFMMLKPKMFHLTDGDINNPIDEHRHIGQGNYNLLRILGLLPESAIITVETDKDDKQNLLDYEKDIENIYAQIKN